jgi:uncharacterized LabA/DUF88 family protein
VQTIAYIDAFNLYFGALKSSRCRWLNLEAWLDGQFPKNTITAIKYFTARVRPFEGDHGSCTRQDHYLAALSTLPRVEIIEGHYLVKETTAMLAIAPPTGSRNVKIIRSEEKQSDVNLACHLLLDASRVNFEAAIVVSGDGDLSTPIRMATSEFHKPVVVLNPQRRSSYHLEQVATAYRGTHYRWDRRKGVEVRTRNDGIRAGLLAASQFPPAVLLSDGTSVIKPATW